MSKVKTPKLADVRANLSRQAKRHSAVMRNEVVPLSPRVDAPVDLRDDMRPKGEAITPHTVVPVQCKAAGYDQRTQLPPDWRPGEGSFSAAGIGRYLD